MVFDQFPMSVESSLAGSLWISSPAPAACTAPLFCPHTPLAAKKRHGRATRCAAHRKATASTQNETGGASDEAPPVSLRAARSIVRVDVAVFRLRHEEQANHEGH